MKHLLFGITVIMAAEISAGTVQAAEEPVWQTDYSKATAMARQLKKPMFVVFR
jgi:hypothetical protein